MQTALSKDDVRLGLTIILFVQNFGPALFVSVAQTVFTNRLSTNLLHLVPDATVARIEAFGLTEIKREFVGNMLDRVVLAFSRSIIEAWYVALGLAYVAILGSLAAKWKSVKQDKERIMSY